MTDRAAVFLLVGFVVFSVLRGSFAKYVKIITG